MTTPAFDPYSPRRRTRVIRMEKLILHLERHWLLVFNLLWGLYVGLPWLAPVFMRLGWAGAGNAIYSLYATQCHQLPERSFFLFGPKGMYALSEIHQAWQITNNPLILRQFVGNAAMGWKVAWSDRMVSMYGGVLFGGWVYGLLRRRMKSLPVWGFAFFCLPMALDGGTHLLSDLAGIGAGFRDSNVWLAVVTGNIFPGWFYAGDALGSFNSWMRLLTGLFFGLGVVWLAFPHIERGMREAAGELEAELRSTGTTT